VAVLVAVVLVGIALFSSPRVGPPGVVPDCQTDPAALVEYSIAQLEDSPGYRWTESEEMWGFDPAFRVSASDPHYAFSGYTAEGVYLAPDQMHTVTTDMDDPNRFAGVGGYPEVIVLGGTMYGFVPSMNVEGVPQGGLWQEVPVEADANRIAAAFPFGPPLSFRPNESISTDPIELSWEVPGDGGCLAWWRLDPWEPGPSGVAREPIVALRIDDQGMIVAGSFEAVRPGLPDEDRRDDFRFRFSVVHEVPDEAEFPAPSGPIQTPLPQPSN